MKKLSTVLLGLGLFVSSALYAAEANKSTTQQATEMKKMHDKMNGMNDEEMKKTHEKMDNMTNEEMKKMHEDMANEKTKNGGYRDWETDRKSTRLNSSHRSLSRMPSSA